MTERTDAIIDRRRLRRKLTFWRIAAIAIAAVAITFAALRMDGIDAKSRDHIARITIDGTITEDRELLDRIAQARKSDSVKGVILSINSPGGTSAGGEATYEAVRKLAEEKPVVAQIGTLAASAGYMIASGADHIVARQSSIVGSIGVLVQIPNVRGLLEKIGVEVDTIKSAPLKAEPSPFNETTESERAMMRAIIDDSYDWFVGLVAERRPLSDTEVRRLADGSVFTGRQALANKLIDALGGQDEAIAWLGDRGVAKNLKVVEWKRREESGLLGVPGLAAAFGRLAGFGGFGDRASQWLSDRMFLDGLVSLWQPENIQE